MVDDTNTPHGRTPHHFEESYTATPPWDIGRPQPAFAELAANGVFRGRVLDAGCGTGEHVLMCADLGLNATGVDIVPLAIDKARDKAQARHLDARFLVHDALELASLGEQFDTVLDCGLFHVFDDPDRAPYVDGLRAVTRPGSVFHMLCFSDEQPGDWGPRRVTQGEIRANFEDGWLVESIEPIEFVVNLDPGRAVGWRSTIARV
jgi:SAM-dependent methyltransferase